MEEKKLVLRNYQKAAHEKILDCLKSHDRALCVLPTGAGKSIVIGHLANTMDGRSLVLTHREEIWKQNSAWIQGLGQLNAKTNTVTSSHKTVIAMAQTLHARIKKYGVDYIGQFDNIILDEVHVDIFKKVYSKYNFKRIIGFTATPISNKTEKRIIHGEEYTRPLSMKRDFDVLIEVVSEQDLVDMGYLCQDKNVALEPPNLHKLVDSSTHPDGYTAQSINEVYSNTAAFEILYEAYQKYCVGKKTMIFNATTKVNAKLYDFLKQKNINVQLYDTKQKHLNRQDVVEWFRDERDAVLINANVFTTGFDVTDIEVVIVNRSTKSLSLWLQMTGRGSRITDIIKKDNFLVIDLGLNLISHGRWSMRRNWNDYFNDTTWKKKNKSDMLNVWECKACGSYNLPGVLMTDNGLVCEYCGEPRSRKSKPDMTGKLVEFYEPVIPKGKDIVKFTKSMGEGSTFAFKLAERRIVALFDGVERDYFLRRKDELLKRIGQIWLPIYFAIIKSELEGPRRTLKKQAERLTNKILQKYDAKKPQN